MSSTVKKIAIIVGSNAQDSVNKKLANALISCGVEGLEFELVNIFNLPLYERDSDSNPPAEWVTFKNKIKEIDGVIFVTPEHNRSFPAAIKNALDIASRPYGTSAWDGKPAAILTASPGNIGGFGANHHLRQVLVFLNMPVLAQPEAYISNAYGLFDENGNLNNDNTKKFLTSFIEAYKALVEKQD